MLHSLSPPRAAPLLLTFISLSCGLGRNTGDNDREQAGQKVVALQVKPENDILLADLNTEMMKPFTVRAFFADGTSADYTRKVRWTLENTSVGKFVGSSFHSAQFDRSKVDFTRVYARFKDADSEVLGVANLTVVWLRTSGNSQDFFFALPYKAAAQKKPLTFSTQVQSLDVFFSVDTTGSMGGAIDQLARSLQNQIIPSVKMAAAKDAWFGVGAVDDFPTSPYGNLCNGGPDDQPHILLQPMTDDIMKAQRGVQDLMRGGRPRGCGGDTPESQMEALYQIATGEGNMKGGAMVPPNHKGIGGVEFRDGALPVVVMVTDASFHTKNEPGRTCFNQAIDYQGAVADAAHTRKETEDALNKICAKVVGVSAMGNADENCTGTRDLVQFAKATGALVPPEAWDVPMRPANCPAGKCCTGQQGAGEDTDANGLCPLVFKVTSQGIGLGEQAAGGISQLARFASFDVVTDVLGQNAGEKGEALPAGMTTADFIRSIVPIDALPPPPPPFIPAPEVTDKGFAKVTPGSFVRFNVEAQNDLVRETSKPQVFHATIRVRAGGCANLDERDVIILIPPTNPTPG